MLYLGLMFELKKNIYIMLVLVLKKNHQQKKITRVTPPDRQESSPTTTYEDFLTAEDTHSVNHQEKSWELHTYGCPWAGKG